MQLGTFPLPPVSRPFSVALSHTIIQSIASFTIGTFRWIEHLEHCLCSAADGGASFFFSGRLTYVDLVVYNAVTAAEVQFPAAWPDLAAHNPKLVAHKERIASLPKVAEYLASDRCRPWAGDSMM